MDIKWTKKALLDLHRLQEFLSLVNVQGAEEILASLVEAPEKLVNMPRMGVRLQEFNPREVHRLIIGPYEMRYEITSTSLYVLRIWHGREQR